MLDYSQDEFVTVPSPLSQATQFLAPVPPIPFMIVDWLTVAVPVPLVFKPSLSPSIELRLITDDE